MQLQNKRHLMVYVKWSIIDRWKREEKAFRQYQRGEVGERAPYAYGSAQCCLYTLSEPGTVIWVVSSPRLSGRLLPPTIIARLCVRNRINRKDSSYDGTEIPSYFSKKWHYVVLAKRPPESFYLPLNNASKEITTELIFKGQKKPLAECPHCINLRKKTDSFFSGLPSHFQRIRELIPGKGEKLTAFAQSVQQGKNVFLSYKQKDARPLAEYLAEKITGQGIGCWWDEWNLPLETPNGQKIDLFGPELKANLVDGLRQSAYMVALVTKEYYDEGSWTSIEWEQALAEQKDKEKRRTRSFKVIEILLDGEPRRGEGIEVIDARQEDRGELAAELLKQISGHN